MALFRLECGGAKTEIWEVDHGPPHCHISGLDQSGTVAVDRITLSVTRTPGVALPPVVRRCLRDNQADMLEAWSRVISYSDRKE